MKKSLLTTIALGCAVSVFGQGLVQLENADNSAANVSRVGGQSPTGSAAAGSYQVALLWFNGSSYQQIGAVYQTTTVNNDGAGFFFGEIVTVPTYSAGGGSFEVQGWSGNFASYAAAMAGGTYLGQTPTFTSAEGNASATPPGAPVHLTPVTPGAGQWTGNLILVPVPEPSTIALGGLGAAALLLFRRRK
jgi:hypothetical protein